MVQFILRDHKNFIDMQHRREDACIVLPPKFWNGYTKKPCSKHGCIGIHGVYSRSNQCQEDKLKGTAYLKRRLGCCRCERSSFASSLIAAVQRGLERDGAATSKFPRHGFMVSARSWISDHLPSLLKAQIKGARVKRLTNIALAYRMVLADKVIERYEAAGMARKDAGL